MAQTLAVRLMPTRWPGIIVTSMTAILHDGVLCIAAGLAEDKYGNKKERTY
jgi:hypothetical protein